MTEKHKTKFDFKHTHLLILVEHFLAAEFVSVALADVKNDMFDATSVSHNSRS